MPTLPFMQGRASPANAPLTAALALKRATISSTAACCCGSANREATRSTVEARDLAASKSPAAAVGQTTKHILSLWWEASDLAASKSPAEQLIKGDNQRHFVSGHRFGRIQSACGSNPRK